MPTSVTTFKIRYSQVTFKKHKLIRHKLALFTHIDLYVMRELNLLLTDTCANMLMM